MSDYSASYGGEPKIDSDGSTMKYVLYGILIIVAIALPFFIIWFFKTDQDEKLKNKFDNLSCRKFKEKICSPDYCSIDDKISASFKAKWNAAKMKYTDLKMDAINLKGDILTEMGDFGTELKTKFGQFAKGMAIMIILIIKLFGDTGMGLANLIGGKLKDFKGDIDGTLDLMKVEMLQLQTDALDFPELKLQMPNVQNDLEFAFDGHFGDVEPLKLKIKNIFAKIPRVKVGFTVQVNDKIYTASLGMPNLGQYYTDFKSKLNEVTYKVGRWDDSLLDKLGSLKVTLKDKYRSLAGDMGRFMILTRKKFPTLDNVELIDTLGSRIGVITGDIKGLLDTINMELEVLPPNFDKTIELHSKLLSKIKNFEGPAIDLKADIKKMFDSFPKVRLDVDVQIE